MPQMIRIINGRHGIRIKTIFLKAAFCTRPDNGYAHSRKCSEISFFLPKLAEKCATPLGLVKHSQEYPSNSGSLSFVGTARRKLQSITLAPCSFSFSARRAENPSVPVTATRRPASSPCAVPAERERAATSPMTMTAGGLRPAFPPPPPAFPGSRGHCAVCRWLHP